MENKKFTKADLKAGYIVKTRDGSLKMVMHDIYDKLIAVEKNDRWGDITVDYTDDMRSKIPGHKCHDIVEVYGRHRYQYALLHINTECRELLWKREPEKTCDQCAHKVVCTHVGMCEHFMAKAE